MKWLWKKFHLSGWDWIILFLGSLPAFYYLGKPAIYIWDEAVYANASWDMAHGHSWLLPTQGHYNTKPPLVLWMQAMSLKLFSSPEWAIRFPSALSVTGICLALIIALRRWGFGQWTRLWVVICFVGHEGFIRHHISRTGDLDAVMSLFVMMYSLVFLDALYFKKWSNPYLLTFFIFVILAFYAKSIAGWLMLGPVLILWILSPLRSVLWSWKFILGGICTIVICGTYYLVRNQLQPGFIELVWHSEYLRIAKNIMPWHEHGMNYYFNNFTSLKIYWPWVYGLLASIGYILFIRKRDEQKTVYLWWIVLGLGYMLTITWPPVKLEWYDAPAYPFFALLMGAVIGEILMRMPGSVRWLSLFPLLLIMGRKINFLQHDIRPRHPFENEGMMLKKIKSYEGLSVFMPAEYPEHQLQLNFYQKIILEKNKIGIPLLEKLSEVKPETRILVRDSPWVDSLSQHFVLDTLSIFGGLGYEFEVHERTHVEESKPDIKIQEQ